MIRRPLILLSILVASILAVPFGMGLLSPQGPAPTPAAKTGDGDCAEDWTPERFLASKAYRAAYTRLGAEAGFLDLHYVSGGAASPHLVAWFDQDRRDEPLPHIDDTVHGLPIEVQGIRFSTLVGAAAEDGLDVELSEPLVPTPCSKRISPGAQISTPVGLCSLSFILRDADGLWYASSAGHCFRGVGDRASISGLGGIGTVVYNLNEGVGRDFALIRIDSDDVAHVDPSMCHWGGPVGTTAGGRDVVRHYGFGVGHSATQFTRPRTGESYSVGVVSFSFIGLVASGDSGSGARFDDGRALGTITHVNMGAVLFAHSAPFAFGTTADRGIVLAEEGTGLDLTLQTAPVRDTL